MLLLLCSMASAYDRSAYRHWVDADGDGQNTRQEILIRDSHLAVVIREDGKVEQGLRVCPYTGRVTTNPRDLDIDHLVALGEIDAAGAHSWTDDARETFANDLDNLVAVYKGSNRSKGDQDASLRLVEREKVAQLEGRQLARKFVLAEEGELPRLHTGAPKTAKGAKA